MPGAESFNRPDKLQEALDVFAEWLDEQSTKGGLPFDQVCAKCPELAEELHRLHSVFRVAQAAVHSHSFHQTLRERFGDAEKVTVTLEEGFAPTAQFAVPPSGGPAGRPAESAYTGRYTLEDEVARGGMGAIFRVRDRDLSRTLAMKVMTCEPGSSTARTDATSRINLARFLEEAQVTAQLDHPGIVPVHEVGFDTQGQPFFTMKLVKGCDLNEIFKFARAEREGWNLPRAVGALIKACQALAYAHAKGVIHRDLKPANIMAGRFGEVFVMDWGLAKITGRKDLHDIRPKDTQLTSASLHSPRHQGGESTPDSPLVTMDGSVVGTPAYMSPEQARGQVEEVNPASDIYSLGAILYSLLTGQPPYVEPGARLTPHTILARVLDGPPRRVHQLAPQTPPELISICEKAMAREKRDRYASSLDLTEDLQAFLDHRVVRAYRTGAVAEFKSWIARNQATALVGGCALSFVLVASVAYIMKERTRSTRLSNNLTRQHLSRGQALCESGDLTRGLHWFARALNEVPAQSEALREVIQVNLTGWSKKFNAPVAYLRHDTLVSAIAYSPDGRRVATTAQTGVAQLWSASTGEPEGEPIRHGAEILGLTFSPEGKLLLTAGRDKTARLWSADTGKSVGPPLQHDADVVSGTFSADGKRVLTASADWTARLWSVETANMLGPPLRHQEGVMTATFSPDGTRAVTLGRGKTARLWSLSAVERGSLAMIHEMPADQAIFSSDGKWVLTRIDRMVHFWSADTGQEAGPSIRHDTRIRIMAINPDGNRLVIASEEGAVRLWSMQTREALGEPVLRLNDVVFAAFGPDGKTVLTEESDRRGRAQLWSVETGQPVGSPMQHLEQLESVAFSPDGSHILVHPHGQAAVLWAVELPRENELTFEDSSGSRALAFSADGTRLAIGGLKSQTRLWSAETGKPIGAVMQHQGRVWAVAFSPDGKSVLTGSGDATARLWSSETGEPLGIRITHKSSVRAVAFSPDGKFIATGSFDKTARVWSTETGQPVGPALVHPNFVEEVAFRPDGKALLTACGDGAARLWSVPSGELLLPLLRHSDAMLAAAFSPDGKLIATGGRDNVVRFWNAANGRPSGWVLEHHDWVEDLRFSRDGRHLWTLTSRATRVWDLETGEPLGPALADAAGAYNLALSPDGTRLAVAENRTGKARLVTPVVAAGEIRNPDLWVQTLTWTEMDDHGALNWLDAGARRARREQLEKLGGSVLK